MLVFLWILSAVLIVLPGLSYFLWQMDVLDRDLFIRHGGILMLSYVVGNIGGLIFILAAIWKTTCTDKKNTETSLPIAGVIGIIAIGIAGYVGMGNYILEFIAG